MRDCFLSAHPVDWKQTDGRTERRTDATGLLYVQQQKRRQRVRRNSCELCQRRLENWYRQTDRQTEVTTDGRVKGINDACSADLIQVTCLHMRSLRRNRPTDRPSYARCRRRRRRSAIFTSLKTSASARAYRACMPTMYRLMKGEALHAITADSDACRCTVAASPETYRYRDETIRHSHATTRHTEIGTVSLIVIIIIIIICICIDFLRQHENRNKIKLKNAWQGLACSSTGIAVSTPSE